jgi:hypothetical protein
MPYGNINVDTVTTSTTGGILGAGNASIMKNRIINGAMVVAQRGTSAVTANDAFPLDRFFITNGTDGSFSSQQSTTAPAGFINSLYYTTTATDTSLGGTQWTGINHRVEGLNCTDLGWGSASAKTITLSFQVRSSLTGTFGGAIANSAWDRSYPFTYTISTADTWTTASITIAGDTSGTWLTTNGIGMRVIFGLGAGATFSGTAGAWSGNLYASATGAVSVIGTLNATFYITGVQLEVGSSATGFEYVNYQTSLANCQRYYETISVGTDEAFVLQCISTTAARGGWQYKVSKRATPTNSSSGTVTLGNATASVNTAATIGFNTGSIDIAAISATGSGSLVAGNATNMAGSTGKLIASAEL